MLGGLQLRIYELIITLLHNKLSIINLYSYIKNSKGISDNLNEMHGRLKAFNGKTFEFLISFNRFYILT